MILYGGAVAERSGTQQYGIGASSLLHKLTLSVSYVNLGVT